MLVMGAHGHSRIRSLIIGSATTAMIRACKVPVVPMRQLIEFPDTFEARICVHHLRSKG